MGNWLGMLKVNPIEELIKVEEPALSYYVRRDLLHEKVGEVTSLWQLHEPVKLVEKQQEDGCWRYVGSGAKKYPYFNHDLVETFRNLRTLVHMYGFNRKSSAIVSAAEYIFSNQHPEGDIRGILGTQYMPYYMGVIFELLILAGYQNDPRIERGLQWLLAVQQDDGGWIIPSQMVPAREKTADFWQQEPLPPDRSLPHAHLATGMVLRAFTAHPEYRQHECVIKAAASLKQRFFQVDKYNDRKSADYWVKFQYPFWWQNLLSALDTLGKLGYSKEDDDIQKGLDWFIRNQEQDGLWPTGYQSGKGAVRNRLWVGLAVCRVLKHYFS